MTLYLDTSALVKLYITEEYRDLVVTAVRESSRIAVSVVAYPEARSAFARQMREGTLTGNSHEAVVNDLDRMWTGFHRVRVTYAIAETAGALTESLALRGFDAIHVASALRVYSRFGDDFRFLVFDDRLIHAARQVVPVYEAG